MVRGTDFKPSERKRSRSGVTSEEKGASGGHKEAKEKKSNWGGRRKGRETLTRCGLPTSQSQSSSDSSVTDPTEPYSLSSSMTNCSPLAPSLCSSSSKSNSDPDSLSLSMIEMDSEGALDETDGVDMAVEVAAVAAGTGRGGLTEGEGECVEEEAWAVLPPAVMLGWERNDEELHNFSSVLETRMLQEKNDMVSVSVVVNEKKPQ